VTDEDIVEQRPIVGGAAARDRGMAPTTEGSTPASALGVQAPRAAVPEPGRPGREPRRQRHPRHPSVLLVA